MCLPDPGLSCFFAPFVPYARMNLHFHAAEGRTYYPIFPIPRKDQSAFRFQNIIHRQASN